MRLRKLKTVENSKNLPEGGAGYKFILASFLFPNALKWLGLSITDETFVIQG